MIDVPRALRCLHALTQRFSAEFAIRPFIAQHPQPTLATLTQWVHDPSVHVRRLVSEGSRPRLPWGQRLQLLVRDPRRPCRCCAPCRTTPALMCAAAWRTT
jgi:3-methyladenine DNA glycosylase AlkC